MSDQRNEQTVALEEKIAYVEKLVSDLDDVVQGLNQRLHEMERDISNLHREYQQHLQSLHEPDIPDDSATR
ncbi:MAG: SlyX family protein [Phycisphaeraceae bacterium]